MTPDTLPRRLGATLPTTTFRALAEFLQAILLLGIVILAFL